jgi:hypothetical protein
MARVILVVAVCFVLQLPALADTHEASGVTFDTRALLSEGWRESFDPAAFPLRIEDKAETMILGLLPPAGHARIFLLYSLPANPLPLDNIDVMPPTALLARLGVRRPEASGTREEKFLFSPILPAIHWTLIGPGNGTTFSAEADPGELTYSLRTILSFVVAGPGSERRPVIVTAFLRCRPGAEAERMKPKFWALLKTLRTKEGTARLVSAEAASAEEAHGRLLAGLVEATILLERVLPALAVGSKLEISTADRHTLESVLTALPADPVATYLRAVTASEPTLEAPNSATREALAAYRQLALKLARALEGRQAFSSWYTTTPPTSPP